MHKITASNNPKIMKNAKKRLDNLCFFDLKLVFFLTNKHYKLLKNNILPNQILIILFNYTFLQTCYFYTSSKGEQKTYLLLLKT